MKRVAILGADFVPSSLPQTLRMRFFATHLPEFGWEPTIITTDPQFYECAVDYENERLLPKDLNVIRTPALPARMARKLGVGDIGMRSMWHHWRALTELCERRLIDLLFIPVPPSVPMVLGRLLYERYGIPYVIDYNDPWVTEYYWKLPRHQRPPKWALAYTMSRVLEPFALRRASHIVGVSKGTTDSVTSRYSWMADTGASEIPHGGEPTDFDFLNRYPRQNDIFDRADGLLHVSYIGACVQPMFQTVAALFSAVRLGLQRTPELFGRLRLHFVGSTYSHASTGLSPAMTLAREHGVENVASEHAGRVPYLDALQLLLDSHALLIIGSEEPHYTASKIFPYILARRPVLAILHEASTVVRILQETNAGMAVTFGEKRPISACTAEISTQLETILRFPGAYQPATSWNNFERYTARTMSKLLAHVFDEVVSKNHRCADGQISALASEST